MQTTLERPTGTDLGVDAAPRVRTTPAAKPTPRPAGGRLAWIDTSRGFIMLTVVVLHVGVYQFLPMTDSIGGRAHNFWIGVNAILGAIRMPALLVISGWLAAGTVAQGINSARARKRIAANGYLFVLWMLIYALVTSVLQAESAPQAVPLETLVRQLIAPDSTLWFLSALVWYTALLAALHKAPKWAVFAGLLLIAAVSDTYLSTTLGLWVKIPQFAVYFALGAYAKPVWKWIAEHPLIALPASVAATWGGIQWENYQTMAAHQWAFPSASALSVAMAALLFSAAGLLARYIPLAAKPFALVGRNTVAVYVLHFPILLALMFVPALNAIPAALLTNEGVRWAWPVVVAALIAAFSLGFRRLTDALGARWLFALPALPDIRPSELGAPLPIQARVR